MDTAEKLCAALQVADAITAEDAWPECRHLMLVAQAAVLIGELGGEVAELQCRQASMWLAPTSPAAAEFYRQLADLIRDTHDMQGPPAAATAEGSTTATRERPSS